jgi:hypothetical protein
VGHLLNVRQDLIEEITTLGELDNGEPISGAFGQIGSRGGLKTITVDCRWVIRVNLSDSQSLIFLLSIWLT